MPALTDNVTFGDLADFLGVGKDPNIESFTVSPRGTVTPQFEVVSTTSVVSTILAGSGLFDWAFGGGHAGSCGAFRDLAQGLFVQTEPVRVEFDRRARDFIQNGVGTPTAIIDEYARFIQVALTDMDGLFDQYRGSNLLGTTMANTRYDQWLTRWLHLPMQFFQADWAWQAHQRHDQLIGQQIACCNTLTSRVNQLTDRVGAVEQLAAAIPTISQRQQDILANLRDINLNIIPLLKSQISALANDLAGNVKPALNTVRQQVNTLLTSTIPSVQAALSGHATAIEQIQATMASQADLEQVRQTLSNRIEEVNQLRQLGDQELRNAFGEALLQAQRVNQNARRAIFDQIASKVQLLRSERAALTAQLREEIATEAQTARDYTQAVRDNLRREADLQEFRLQSAIQDSATSAANARQLLKTQLDNRIDGTRQALVDRIESRIGDVTRFVEAVRDQARAFNVSTNQSLQNQMRQLIGQLRFESEAADLGLQGQIDQLGSLVDQRWTQTQNLVELRHQQALAFTRAREAAINARTDLLLDDIWEGVVAADETIFTRAIEADATLRNQLQADIGAVRDYVDARESFILDAVQGWLADSEATAIERESALEQRITDFILGQGGGASAIEQLIAESVEAQTAGLREFLLANDEQIRADLENALASAIQSVNDTFSPQIDQLQADLGQLDLDTQQALSDLETRFTGELSQQILDTQQLFEQRFTELDDALRSELNRIETEGATRLADEVARLEGEIGQLQQQLQAQQANIDIQLGQINQRLAEIEQATIPALRQELTQQLLDLETQLTAVDEALRTQLLQLEQAIQQTIPEQITNLQTQVAELWTTIGQTILPTLTTHAQLLTSLQDLIDLDIQPRIDQNEICCSELRQWRDIEVNPRLAELLFDVDVLNLWRVNTVDVFITNTTNFITNIDQVVINAIRLNCEEVRDCLDGTGNQEPSDFCDFGIRAWGIMAECWLQTFTLEPDLPQGPWLRVSEPTVVADELDLAFADQPTGLYASGIQRAGAMVDAVLAGSVPIPDFNPPAVPGPDEFVFQTTA